MIKKQTNPKSIIPKPRARSTLERFGINQGASTPVASNLISNLKKGTADFLKITGISPLKIKEGSVLLGALPKTASRQKVRSLSKDPYSRNRDINFNSVYGESQKIYPPFINDLKGINKESRKLNKTMNHTFDEQNELDKSLSAQTEQLDNSINDTSNLEFRLSDQNNKNPNIQKKFEAKLAQLRQRADHKNLDIMKKSKASILTEGDLQKIEIFFRFRIHSVFKIVDEKIKSNIQWSKERNKKKVIAGPSFGPSSPKKEIKEQNGPTYDDLKEEIWKQLKRVASTKSKYRFRDVINFDKKIQTVAKNIVERRSPKRKFEFDLELDEYPRQKSKSPDKRDRDRDRDCSYKLQEECAKIFIIIGGYPDLRKALLKRGWIENPDPDSRVFQLKWVLKRADAGYDTLEPFQYINHFDRNTSITTKAGLARNIRNLIWYENEDVDDLYPRCYDVNDIAELDDFLDDYKFNQAIATLHGAIDSKDLTYQVPECNMAMLKICVANDICQRRLKPIEEIIRDIFKSESPLVTQEEYEILYLQDWNMAKQNDKYYKYIKKAELRYGVNFADENTKILPNLVTQSEETLKRTEAHFPQAHMNKGKNVWIVKPAGLSRGRGIACYNNLAEIIEHIKIRDVDWVVQKYIENPLIILNRKFDIRQWVLVTDWNPLTIWFYDECYIRFTANNYNPDDFSNKFSHLTNNSIAKYANNFDTSEIEGNMWTCMEFNEHLKKTTGKDTFFETIQPQMKKIVIKSLQSVQDMVNSRKNSFELYGYDFMIDNDHKPWLIEINSSPTMEYSTTVTERLVKMVMEDVVKVVVDYGMARQKVKRNIDTGLFKLICYGKPCI